MGEKREDVDTLEQLCHMTTDKLASMLPPRIFLNSISFMLSTKPESGVIVTSLARRKLNQLAMAGGIMRMDALLHRLCSSLLTGYPNVNS